VIDRLGVSRAVVILSRVEIALANLFDGHRTIEEIADQTKAPTAMISALAVRLEEALFLSSPRLREQLNGPVRPPSCIGAYPEEPDEIRFLLDLLFEKGAGQPGPSRPDGGLCAVLAPHIDYARGGLTYTHAFRELAERTDASLFVIVATSHYGRDRFTLTRKHFETPLGVAQTDQPFIDRLVAAYGDGLFDDEIDAHLPEHSIELEVVFLQYLFEGKRPFRIVPLLVGSFQDAIRTKTAPGSFSDIARMVEALREAERGAGEPVCYVISGDLAHIGPKFGQGHPVSDEQLTHCQAQDMRLLEAAGKVDGSLYAQIITEEEDERNICGYPPTWLAMEVARPTRGKLLDYGRYVHSRGKESVSFASMSFER
jgi:AmmeMemoRadiSam system protein B